MGLSLGHLVLILIILLVVLGPSRFGDVGRGIGEAMRGFKKGLHGDDAIDVTDGHRRELDEPAVDPLTRTKHDEKQHART